MSVSFCEITLLYVVAKQLPTKPPLGCLGCFSFLCGRKQFGKRNFLKTLFQTCFTCLLLKILLLSAKTKNCVHSNSNVVTRWVPLNMTEIKGKVSSEISAKSFVLLTKLLITKKKRRRPVTAGAFIVFLFFFCYFLQFSPALYSSTPFVLC